MTLVPQAFEDPTTALAGSVRFFVPGIPAPGGSKRYLGRSKTGKAIIRDDAGDRNVNWKNQVASYASAAFRSIPKFTSAVMVQFEFVLPRIKSHYYPTGARKGHIRSNAPFWHVVKPDALKLSRSTEDALTGIAWVDDSANCELQARKTYGDQPGCVITITPLA